ncbi:MAG: HD domain-containing protein, partial [Bacteroidota bacterium]
EALLAALQEQLRTLGLHQDVQFQLSTQQHELTCDPARIQQVLVNTITDLKADTAQQVLVTLADTQLTYPLKSLRKDYVKKVPAISFTVTTQATPSTVAPQYVAHINGGELPMPETTQELAAITNRRIIKAHYGYTNVAGTQLQDPALYVIPLQLRDVRTADMDKPYMELGAELVRADDHYKDNRIDAQAQEQAFLAAVKQNTNADMDLVEAALEVIKWYHGPVRRKSGEPFYLHPVAVAHIVLDYNQDEATVLGALLHDTVEDTPMLLENIETMFGKEVSGIVDGVTHLESHKDTFYKIKLSVHENILLLLEVSDQRSLYVKIADRMHNMRTIKAKKYASQRRTAEETLHFFVPLAERLGLHQAAAEFKALCLEVFETPSS